MYITLIIDVNLYHPQLLTKADEIFKDKKTRDYVKVLFLNNNFDEKHFKVF